MVGAGDLLGLFPVNTLHNLVHQAIGVAAVVRLGRVVLAARALAVVYGLLALTGLVPGLNITVGFIFLFGHDV